MSNIKQKRKARRLALQALYQWDMTKEDLTNIEAQFMRLYSNEKMDGDYFHTLLHQVPAHLNVIEEALKPYLNRPIESLNPIELTILRLSGFELMYSLELPYKVVLNEAISMAKEYGSQDGYRFVNGVLNGLAKQIRQYE